ncbi:MAG: hypothetical protein AAB900_02935, partial [Patescibacteria group bacterium]
NFLFPWLFQLLQHKNGNIRQAGVRMIQTELGPLTYHLRFPGKESGLSKERADSILFGLRTNLDHLAASAWQPAYDKCEYVEELPSGTYKSIQLIFSLLDDYCGEVSNQARIESMPPLSQAGLQKHRQILERRKEIEQEIVEMLEETDSDFSLQDVRAVIYHESGSDDLMKALLMFDRGGGASELSNVLELLNDAWNYFPHEVLGGISPAEKLLEYQDRQRQEK